MWLILAGIQQLIAPETSIEAAMKLMLHMKTKTFYTVSIIDIVPNFYTLTQRLCFMLVPLCLQARRLHQTREPLCDALFRLPNLFLHPVQKKTVGGKQHWIFYMVRKKGLFFFQVVWERTISYSLYTVRKAKPTQNPCWHWRPHSQWVHSHLGLPVVSKWCKCGRIYVCLDRFLLDLGILLCVPTFSLFSETPCFTY